ncbi:hypothetical protein SHIRM173S_00763 [Streptomyces hirsutus]
MAAIGAPRDTGAGVLLELTRERRGLGSNETTRTGGSRSAYTSGDSGARDGEVRTLIEAPEWADALIAGAQDAVRSLPGGLHRRGRRRPVRRPEAEDRAAGRSYAVAAPGPPVGPVGGTARWGHRRAGAAAGRSRAGDASGSVSVPDGSPAAADVLLPDPQGLGEAVPASANSPSRRASPAEVDRHVPESSNGSACAVAPAWARRYAAPRRLRGAGQVLCDRARTGSPAAPVPEPREGSARAARPSAARASSARSRTANRVGGVRPRTRVHKPAARAFEYVGVGQRLGRTQRVLGRCRSPAVSVYRHRCHQERRPLQRGGRGVRGEQSGGVGPAGA